MILPVSLSQDEMDVVQATLSAAMDPSFFPDWEFQTLIGVDRPTLAKMLDTCRNGTASDEEFVSVVVNTLNNLLGYPHGQEELLLRYVPQGPASIRAILDRMMPAGATHTPPF